MYLKKIICLIILLTVISTLFPASVSAEGSDSDADNAFLWILTETTENDKTAEIAEFNSINEKKYKFTATGSGGEYSFNLDYTGADLNQGNSGRYYKKGDSASAAIKFGAVPEHMEFGEIVAVTLEIELTSDTTFDKAYEFMKTQGTVFFDKAGAQPDIPSSEAIYFNENAGEEKGTAVGTKSDAAKSITTTLYAAAPRGSTEGEKISICCTAQSTLSVGVKYIYEWLPADRLENANQENKSRTTTLNNVNGNISVYDGKNNPISAKDGMILSEGDTIKSAKDASCEIKFNNNSFFNLKESSELLLSETAETNTQIKLLSGKTWAYIHTTAGEGMFKVETAYASLSTEGAIFALEIADNGTTVWIFTRNATITSAVTGELITLESGEKAEFNKDGKIKIENFNLNDTADIWGIPHSSIVEDNGYAWVYKFIYVLCAVLVITISLVYFTVRKNKKKALRRISKFVPESGQCLFCGKQLEPGALFCPECGATVKSKKPPQEDSFNNQI